MHRLAATPGGWTPDQAGVIFVEQTPAPVVVITAADTDLQCLAQVMAHPRATLPPVRGVNLLQLQQELTIDTYADQVLRQARVILIRLLGGRSYWAYGLEVVRELALETGADLVVVPGDDSPDPALISLSTVPLGVANQVWRYLCEGGQQNLAHGLMVLCDRALGTQFQPPPPQPVSRVGRYIPPVPLEGRSPHSPTPPSPHSPLPHSPTPPLPFPSPGTVGILFYRAHYLAGNTAPIDALITALIARHLTPVAIYVSSLQDPEVQAELIALLSTPDISTPQNSTLNPQPSPTPLKGRSPLASDAAAIRYPPPSSPTPLEGRAPLAPTPPLPHNSSTPIPQSPNPPIPQYPHSPTPPLPHPPPQHH